MDRPDPDRSYVQRGCRVTSIIMVYNESDLEPQKAIRKFHPDMCHQVFGTNECIYGYRNLSINIYYLAKSAKCFLEIKYSDMAQRRTAFGNQPDNIMEKLRPWLPNIRFHDKELFLAELHRENRTNIFGRLLSSFTVHNTLEDVIRKYKIAVSYPSDKGFTEFHARFQTLIVWYIDAANMIDITDPRWMIVYLYEEGETVDGSPTYYPIGYCSIYRFFHYPRSVRPRISQFFIIPPCQRSGLGTKLLKTVYQLFLKVQKVIDISVEDPSLIFKNMRDGLDATLLMQLDEFQYPSISNGFSNALAAKASSVYKINRKQAHRIYQLLRMYYLLGKEDTQEYKDFKAEVTLLLDYGRMPHKFLKNFFHNGVETQVVDVDTVSATEEYMKGLTDAARRLHRRLQKFS